MSDAISDMFKLTRPPPPPTGAEESGCPEVSMGHSGLLWKTKSTYQIRNVKAY
jgi:hypothetical protein